MLLGLALCLCCLSKLCFGVLRVLPCGDYLGFNIDNHPGAFRLFYTIGDGGDLLLPGQQRGKLCLCFFYSDELFFGRFCRPKCCFRGLGLCLCICFSSHALLNRC